MSSPPTALSSTRLTARTANEDDDDDEGVSYHAFLPQKFQEPTAPYMPPAIACWVSALEAVNLDVGAWVKHDLFELLRGYLAFDPDVLATAKNFKENRFWIYIVVWLSIRCSWFAYVTQADRSSAGMPSPQQWKSFLCETIGRKMGLFSITFRNSK